MDNNRKAIVNANILTGTGAEMIRGGILLVEGDTITEVGAANVPSDYEVIDANGMTVMPGLIDAHMHFFGAMQPRMFRTYAPELGLLKSIHDAKHLLECGFTTVRECGGMNGLYMRDAAKLGLIEGVPKIIAAGHVLMPTNSGLDDPEMPVENFNYDTNRAKEFLISDGVDACLKNARRAILKGGEFIKIFMTGNYAFPHCDDETLVYTDEEIKAIVAVAENAHTYVAAHCMSDAACQQAIRCGVKSIEHTIGISEETAKLAAENGVTMTAALTFVMCEPVLNQYAFDKIVRGYKAVRKAGGVLAIGSDMNSSPLFPLGKNAWELKYLVDYCGYSALEAVTIGTKNGAIACRIEDRGTLEKGMKADIIFVNGDPSDDIGILTEEQSIRKVFLDGELIVDKDC